MSLKMMSLGSMSSAARGILLTALSTGTPVNVSITAGHRQRNGSRIAIAGLAADNAINGEWTLSGVAAGSATLVGSSGAAAISGTAVVAALCDTTPFHPGHAAVAMVSVQGAAVTAAVGTIVIEQADSMTLTGGGGFYYTNTSGVATSGFKDAALSGEIAMPAFALGSGCIGIEVKLSRYMTARASAWTSGTFLASLLA